MSWLLLLAAVKSPMPPPPPEKNNSVISVSTRRCEPSEVSGRVYTRLVIETGELTARHDGMCVRVAVLTGRLDGPSRRPVMTARVSQALTRAATAGGSCTTTAVHEVHKHSTSALETNTVHV